MKRAVLDQTRFEMHERVRRLDFKRCRIAIPAERNRINVPRPIQVAADNHCPRSHWVADPERPLEAASGGARHAIAGGVQFTGTRLLHRFAGDHTVRDQCDEPYRRHGVKDWKDPSKPWVSRGLTFSWPRATNWLTFACTLMASIFTRHSSNSLFSRTLVSSPTIENKVMKKSSAIRMRSLA